MSYKFIFRLVLCLVVALVSCDTRPIERPLELPPTTTPYPATITSKDEVQLDNGQLRRIGVGLLWWKGKPVWSPDGRLIALPTTNGIYLYDATTLRQVRHLFSPVRSRAIAISPNSKWLLSADMDGKRNNIEI